jgi:hypothetical protein
MIVQDILTSQGKRLRLNLAALNAAIRTEAHSSTEQAQEMGFVLTQILQLPISSLSINCMGAIIDFLRHVVDACTFQEQDQIARWVQSIALSQQKRFVLKRLVMLMGALADKSLVARTALPDLIAHLPAQEAVEQSNRLLRFQPIAEHPSLERLDKLSQVFLVKFYRQQVHTDPHAVTRLLHAAQFSIFQEVAVAASQSLKDIAASVDQMYPLLQSKFPGVRNNTLQAISKLTGNNLQLDATQLSKICLLLSQEGDQATGRLLCEIVANWVQHHRQVPIEVPGVVGQIPAQLLQKGTLDGGFTRVWILAMKAIAQSQPDHLNIKQFNQQVRQLLRSINLGRVSGGEAEMLELLSALERLNRQNKLILTEIVREDCPDLAQKGWDKNICAVIKTIRRVENEHSLLLNEIGTSFWLTQNLKNCFLEAKGI